MSLQDAFFGAPTTTPSTPTPSVNSVSSLSSAFFATPSSTPTATNNPSTTPSLSSQFFGTTTPNPNEVSYNPQELTSVSWEHPWEAYKAFANGAAADVGSLVSGIGNIASTPFKVANNLIHGKANPIDDTMIGSMVNLVQGTLQSLTGGQGTLESQAMKDYYSQYLTHPVDMIVNHPVNTLLDLASILDAGSTSAGFISRTGEVGDLLSKAKLAQTAGRADEAATLFKQANEMQAVSTSGKAAAKFQTAQDAINPISIATKGVGKVLDYAAPTLKAKTIATFNRASALGVADPRQADFMRTANRFESMTDESKAAFLSELEPKVQPLINNPELTKIVTDGLDRPSLVKDMPAVKTIVDGIQEVFNKHVTEPELSSGILKYLSEDGYMEHTYEALPDTIGTQRYRSYLINGKNNEATQILRFDPIDGSEQYMIGTKDFHNLSEVDKGDSPYRLFEDADGKQYTAKRPTYSELADAGLQPKGLADSLEHRANTSFANQAKVKVLDQLGQEFGQLEKPTEAADSLGKRWVKSSTIRTPDGQFYYVPEDIENAAKNYFNYLPHNNLVQALISGGQTFKKLLYAFPGSSLVHSIHLAFNSALGGLNVADLVKAFRGISSEDDIFSKYKAMGGGTDLGTSYFDKSPGTVEDLVKPKTLLSKFKDSPLNPFGENYIQNKALSKEGDFLHHALYRKALLQTGDQGAALDFANKFAGHYSNLTDEEKMLQAIFPFYSWMKQSVPLNANALTEQAGKLNLARWISSGFNLKENDNVAKGQIPLGTDEQGMEHYLTAPLPLNDVRSILNDFPSYAYTRLNPVISVPWSIESDKQNPFNTDPNLQSLNQITNPAAPNPVDDLQYASGKFFNPLSLIYQHKDLENFLLNSGGLYQSILNPPKAEYYDRLDTEKNLASVKKDYAKAIKAGDTYHATYFNRQIQLFQQQLAGTAQ